MYRRFRVLFIIIILFTLIMNTTISVEGLAQKDRRKVLLLYDQRNYFGYVQDIVTSFRELIGHFKIDVTEKNEESYIPGEIKGYDYVFIIGIEGNFINTNLIEDLKKTDNTICWIGKGVEQFLEENDKYTLKFTGTITDVVKAIYKNNIGNKKKFNIGVKREFTILEGDWENIKIYSWITDGMQEYPYILKEKNFWYVSRAEVDSVLFYIVADVLYDIFNVDYFGQSSIYVRIEDVHPFRDTKELREIAEYLNSKDIPFMIALIPAYKSTETGYVTKMSENKEFIDTIKYMQKLGGSVVLHGYSHQGPGEETGEGYEFWDGINDRPIQENLNKWIHTRIGKGIEECVKNDIYPLAFEAPHYAISQDGYKILKKYFSTYVGQVQISDLKFTTVSYPYKLYDTKLFHKLIPENLGYISLEDPLSTNKIFENLSKVSIVRGFTAGFFYHSYLDFTYLKEIIERLEAMNVKFYDLKAERHWVKWEDISILCSNGKITVENPNKYENVVKQNNFHKNYFPLTIRVLIIIVLIICTVFLFIFLYSKIKNNKNLFR